MLLAFLPQARHDAQAKRRLVEGQDPGQRTAGSSARPRNRGGGVDRSAVLGTRRSPVGCRPDRGGSSARTGLSASHAARTSLSWSSCGTAAVAGTVMPGRQPARTTASSSPVGLSCCGALAPGSPWWPWNRCGIVCRSAPCRTTRIGPRRQCDSRLPDRPNRNAIGDVTAVKPTTPVRRVVSNASPVLESLGARRLASPVVFDHEAHIRVRSRRKPSFPCPPRCLHETGQQWPSRRKLLPSRRLPHADDATWALGDLNG